ncbi:MAG TPA: CsbD family protein [Actinomycetota bacterium]|nr:CsbD family protein [Actinomycetota bacterium]
MPDRSEQIEGKAKEVAGKLTGDDELESEGRTQKATEDFKQNIEEAGDKIKGAGQAIKDKVTGE